MPTPIVPGETRLAWVVPQQAVPLVGLLQLLASVVLLSSAWPLTKIALAVGSTPLWFAEGRAMLSGMGVFGALARLRPPGRADWPAILAVGGLQPGAYSALAHEAVVGCAAWPHRRRA